MEKLEMILLPDTLKELPVLCYQHLHTACKTWVWPATTTKNSTAWNTTHQSLIISHKLTRDRATKNLVQSSVTDSTVTFAWWGCCIMPRRSWYTKTCNHPSIMNDKISHDIQIAGKNSILSRFHNSICQRLRQKVHTWPLQKGPAPMPIVGMCSAAVTAAAIGDGMHSSTSEKHPTACNANACSSTWVGPPHSGTSRSEDYPDETCQVCVHDQHHQCTSEIGPWYTWSWNKRNLREMHPPIKHQF